MYDDSDDLTRGELKQIEHLLKSKMSTQMGSIQQRRALGETPNIATSRDYVKNARALRKVLKRRRRQSYVPVREMCNGIEWIDDTAELLDLSIADDLLTVVRALHDNRPPHIAEPESVTYHENVPGKPA